MSSRGVVGMLKRADENKLQEELENSRQEERNNKQRVYTNALELLRGGKSLLDVTIELGVKTEETREAFIDFVDLRTFGEFGIVYEDVKDCLPAILALYRSIKEKGLGPKDAMVALEYASNMKKAQKDLQAVADAVVQLQSEKEALIREKLFL